MRSPQEKPVSAICPRTGSRVFIRDELLELSAPIDVVCPICDHWHVWNPVTQVLEEDATGDDAAREQD